MDNKTSALYCSVIGYFKNNKESWDLFLEFTKYRSRASLRTIEHFITHYAREKELTIQNKERMYLNIYDEYRSRTKLYTKQRFDFFCRKHRIDVKLHGTATSTTVGQLMFFRWLIRDKVIAVLEEHKDQVVQSLKKMRNASREGSKTSPVAKTPTGHSESISIKISQLPKVHNLRVSLDFS